tara:strand:- start:34119 stop:38813 length:4695 start_codon:yes stop_codon:yes gene_type:complete
MKKFNIPACLTILFLVVNLSSYSQKIILPIEVLGAEGTIEERSFTLSPEQLAKVDKLWLQVNNIGYENKASIKINNQNWVDLNHQSVKIQSPERERGGMSHGGHNTIRFSLPSTGITSALNTIQFRFNSSDAISNGYRVVKLNLLDTSENKILDDSFFENDDPLTWKSPYYDTVNGKEPDDIASKIAQGKDYWYNANLISNYLQPGKKGFWYGYKIGGQASMNAKCTSCHTQDGRDLEIFSYSNKSIIERSKFHMLSEEEGKLIATYIRSLSEEHDNVGRYGRPWNPPYQPGPAIANRPIEEWAAGAGLDAVLEADKDMLPYMFPKGVDQEKVYDRFDSEKMVDRTILPLAIQFPDWKHWLPLVHPMDAYTKNNHWNDPFSNFDPIKGGSHYFHHPKKAYQDFRDYLEAMPPVNRNKGELMDANRTFWFHYRGFLEIGNSSGNNHWRTPDGIATKNLADGIPREMAATSLARLMAVQFFEIMNEFDLQDKAHWFAPAEDQTADRQWFGRIYQVFEVPAHFQASVSEKERPINDGYDIVGDGKSFYGQSRSAGVYESTNWYNLQSVVNGGNGMVSSVAPVDYNYVPDFIVKAGSTSGIYEPLRYYHNMNTMYQTRSWSGGGSPTSGKGFKIRVQGPWHIIGRTDRHNLNDFKATVWPTFLDRVKPGMSKWVLNAQLRQFLTEVQKPENSLSNWDRSTNGTSTNLDAIGKKTENLKDMDDIMGRLDYWADKMYLLFPEFKELGVDCQILEEMIDWSEEAWPNINWSPFRNQGELQLDFLTDQGENCATSSNMITAQTTNEGDNPLYEWWVNGEKVVNNTNELDASEIRPGALVKCRVTSSKDCISNGWVANEFSLPNAGINIKVRKNNGTWGSIENTLACVDDTIEFKVPVALKEPLFWLDAMDVNNNGSVPNEGSRVSKWFNKSTSGYTMNTQLNAALKPSYSKTGMNGLPALMFGMNDPDGLELLSTSTDHVLNEDWTIVVATKYYKEASEGDWNALLGNENNNSGLGFYLQRNSGRTRLKVNGDQEDGRYYEDGTDFVLMIMKEGKKIKTYINGKLENEIEFSSANMQTSRGFYLGQRDGGDSNTSWFHKGPVSEVLFYDRTITDVQKEYLEGYLMHKWKFENKLSLDHTYKENSPLDVNLNTSNGETLFFDGNMSSNTVLLDENEKFGEYTFTTTGASCAESTALITITNSGSIGDDIVKYSVNEGNYKVGNEISVTELNYIQLLPNYTVNGNYQWEEPDGTLLALNVNPEKFAVTFVDNRTIWKLHLKQDVVSCIMTDQIYNVTLNVTEVPESEKDDDLDGVKNDVDQCPNSIENAIVNSVGCFDLPVNNFIIEAIGENCLNANNGSISINAGATYNYTLMINGSDTYEFANEITIDNLIPGDYSICMTVEGEAAYEQCFNLEVNAAEAIMGSSVQSKNGNIVTENIVISSGTAPYTVSVNGKKMLTTASKNISVNVNHGDEISITTVLTCEGVFSTDVDLMEYFTVYPNPTTDFVQVIIPNVVVAKVMAVVYNSLQQRVSEKEYELIDGKIKISFENMPSGVYFVKLNLKTPVNLKIVKH